MPLNGSQTTAGERDLAFWRDSQYRGPFIYVLQALPSTPVKVGYATDVQRRIAVLQTGNPYRLRALYVIPADQRLEGWLHRYMRDSRLGGEWFDGPNVAGYLEQIRDMAESMVQEHSAVDGPPAPTLFEEYSRWIPYRLRRSRPGRSRPEDPGTRRFVEPDPVPPEEVEARLRAHWMRPVRGERLDAA